MTSMHRQFTIFQSTLSVRRATSPSGSTAVTSGFQSTLSVRRATSAASIPPKRR